MHDWFDMAARLRHKIYEMSCYGTLYGYKWYAIGGNWVVYLVKKRDVYLAEWRGVIE